MKSKNMIHKTTAIHESAHAVFGHLLGYPTVRLQVYENLKDNKHGEMFASINLKTDILTLNLKEYKGNKKEIDIATRNFIFVLIAGNCAEKFHQNQHPDFPPESIKGSDAYYCYEIIKKLCLFNSIYFDDTKFLQVYYNLMELTYEKCKDKNIFSVIERLANKLVNAPNMQLENSQVNKNITWNLIRKIIFCQFKLKPFLEIDIIKLIEKPTN